jgi:dihydroorotate dehydrogenase
MQSIRNWLDKNYLKNRNKIFKKNGNDAHRAFVKLANWVTNFNLEELILDNHKEMSTNPVPISNAAGFNKNADIPLTFLYHLGFDRVVVGTVTGEPNKGAPEPNIKRYTDKETLVNWMSLPGEGALKVSRRLEKHLATYQNRIPFIEPKVTINLMATPNSKDPLSDIAKTIILTKDIKGVDRYELNISCPNTEALTNYETTLRQLIETASLYKKDDQDLYLKISPDTIDPNSNEPITAEDVDLIVSIANEFGVAGYTTTNTTRYRDPAFINPDPGKGGASGDAVYDRSLAAQQLFRARLPNRNRGSFVIACGGINSPERLTERLSGGANEIQIFTPLIFQGPKLLTDLKTADYSYK